MAYNNIISNYIMARDEHAKIDVVRSHGKRYNQHITICDVISYLLALEEM